MAREAGGKRCRLVNAGIPRYKLAPTPARERPMLEPDRIYLGTPKWPQYLALEFGNRRRHLVMAVSPPGLTFGGSIGREAAVGMPARKAAGFGSATSSTELFSPCRSITEAAMQSFSHAVVSVAGGQAIGTSGRGPIRGVCAGPMRNGR